MTDGDLRLLIAAKIEALNARDASALLGVDRGASEAELERAYTQLVELLRPERLERRRLGRMRPDADRVYLALGEAYTALCEEARQAAYGQPSAHTARAVMPLPEGIHTDELMVNPPGSFSREERLSAAKEVFDRGAKALKVGDRTGAKRHFERALELDPENAVCSLRLGQLYLEDPDLPMAKRLELAKQPLQSAAAHDPYSADVRYAMASYWRATGYEEGYRRELQAVLRCDKDHAKALAELRALESLGGEEQRQPMFAARQKKKRPSGLRNAIGRLFGGPGE